MLSIVVKFEKIARRCYYEDKLCLSMKKLTAESFSKNAVNKKIYFDQSM